VATTKGRAEGRDFGRYVREREGGREGEEKRRGRREEGKNDNDNENSNRSRRVGCGKCCRIVVLYIAHLSPFIRGP
jgi:hypothetical protein